MPASSRSAATPAPTTVRAVPAVLLGLLACAVLQPTHAQDPLVATGFPQQARGITADAAFDFKDLDAVNTLNGTVSISLPLSPGYPLPGGNSYQFTAHYSSESWDAIEATCFPASGGTGPDPDYSPIETTAYIPKWSSNMGHGWELSFGRLLEPGSIGGPRQSSVEYLWERPDGSTMAFRQLTPSLPPGVSATNSQGIFLDRESGTRLSFAADSQGNRAQIELTDGSAVQFREVRNIRFADNAYATEWRATRIYLGHRDHDNYLDIAYDTTNDRWTVSDSAGQRSHTLQFAPEGRYPRDPAQPAQSWRKFERLISLDLAGHGGARLQITPEYSETTSVQMHRLQSEVANNTTSCRRGRYGSGSQWADNISYHPSSSPQWRALHSIAPPAYFFAAQYLVNLRLADQSYYSFSYFLADRQRFVYSVSPPALPPWEPESQVYAENAHAGALRWMRYPNGRWVRWLYNNSPHTTYSFPDLVGHGQQGRLARNASVIYGVLAREVHQSSTTRMQGGGPADAVPALAAGSELKRTEYVARGMSGGVGWAPPDTAHDPARRPPCYLVRTVVDPLGSPTGRRTEFYYNAISSERFRALRGKPFAACDPLMRQGVAGEPPLDETTANTNFFGPGHDPAVVRHPRYLPEELRYPSNGTGPFLSSVQFSAKNVPLRSQWVRYAVLHDGLDENESAAVLVQEETRYHDSNGVVVGYLRTSHDGYDGLGSFHRTSTSARLNAGTRDAPRWVDIGPEQVQRRFESLLANPGNSEQPIYQLDFPKGPQCTAGDPAWNCTQVTGALALDARAAWLLGRVVREESSWRFHSVQRRTTVERCFDARGFMQGERTRDNAATCNGGRCATDVLQTQRRDAHGNVIERIAAGADRGGLPTSSICPPVPALSIASRQRFRHDANGALLAQTTVSAAGNRALPAATSANDAVTGLPQRVTDPSGVQVVYAYDATGRLTESRYSSANGASVRASQRYAYSFPSWSNPALATELRSWSCDDGLSACNYGGSGVYQSALQRFDLLGRLVQEERREADQQVVLVDREFDALGRMLWETVPRTQASSAGVARTSFAYDDLDRQIRLTQPDGAIVATSFSSGADWRRTVSSKVIGESGQAETMTDSMLADAAGRVLHSREQLAASPQPRWVDSSYFYADNGKLSDVCVNDNDDDATACPATGQRREFHYDSRGFLLSTRHPEQSDREIYGYDAAGRLLWIDGPGTTFDRHFRYDPFGRASQTGQNSNGQFEPVLENFYARRNSANGSLSANRAVEARYHQALALDGTTPQQITVTEQVEFRDPVGQLSHYRVRASSGLEFTSGMGFNARGELSEQRYPECIGQGCVPAAARAVQYSYDTGRLRSVASGSQSFIQNVDYFANGSPRSVQRGNGLEDVQTLDAHAWRVASHATRNAANTILFGQNDYRYDERGNLVQLASIRADGSPCTVRYRYDGLNRLLSGESCDASGLYRQTIEYDSFGNLTRLTNTTVGSGAVQSELLPENVDAASNRLRGLPGTPITEASFDGAGNVTALRLANSTGQPRIEFDYDVLGHLRRSRDTGVQQADADNVYLYTASGERLARFDTQQRSGRWTPRASNNRVLREFQQDASGAIRLTREAIDLGGTTVAEISGGGQVSYLHQDHLGSTRLETDAGGAVRKRFSYWPFGGYTPGGDGGAPQGIRFTGHERDSLGRAPPVDYLHARYAALTIGRFLAVDPVLGEPGRSQSWNRYRYANNNPVVLVDPDGRDAVVKKGFKVTVKLVEFKVLSETISAEKVVPPPPGMGSITPGGYDRFVGDVYRVETSTETTFKFFNFEYKTKTTGTKSLVGQQRNPRGQKVPYMIVTDPGVTETDSAAYSETNKGAKGKINTKGEGEVSLKLGDLFSQIKKYVGIEVGGSTTGKKFVEVSFPIPVTPVVRVEDEKAPL